MNDERGTVDRGRTGRRIDELGRETRESAALVLLTLAVVVTVSFVGLAIA